MGNILHRINKIAEEEGITLTSLEASIGASKGVLTRALSKNTDIQSKWVVSIVENYPRYSAEWLLLGKGSMLNPINVGEPDPEYSLSSGRIRNITTNETKLLIPYFDLDFAAGELEMYNDQTISPDYWMDIPEFRGCTAFRAYSDSMEDLIKSGNILFGRKIDDWFSHLEYGQIYGITLNDGRRYLKYIRKAKSDKTFLLRSYNKEYDDFEVPKDKIKNVWLIEGWLNKRV